MNVKPGDKGVPPTELGVMFKVTKQNIKAIVERKTWKHV